MEPSKKSLLVIEDDDSIRELLEELFLSEGYEVYLAEQGEAGLQRLSEEKIRPGVILLDLSMAVMDGRTFLQELPKRCPEACDIPIILMTAAGAADIPEHPADQILHKPLDIDRLITAVAKFARP